MQKIAETEYYVIAVDEKKNRAYLTLRKFWAKPEGYQNYIDDWKKAYQILKRGFTVCADMREASTFPPHAQQMHEAAQKTVKEAGILVVAEVLSKDQILAMQVKLIDHRAELPKNRFASIEEAEQWLDAAVLAGN